MHKRKGAQEPRCARSEGRCGAVGFYVVVAATAGREGEGRGPEDPLDRPTQDASGVAQFTPLRQLRPPEVRPLVSHGRLDTGTSALEDTADLDSEVNFHWRQDSADGLEYRRFFFVPLRKGEILALEHWQESSLRARADTLRGFLAEGATCSNTTFSYYFSLNRRQWIAACSCSRRIGGGQCASVAATSSLHQARGTFPFRSQWLRGNPTCRVPVNLRAFDDGVTACDRCLEGSPLVSRSLCHPNLGFHSPWTRCRMDLSHDSYSYVSEIVFVNLDVRTMVSPTL